MKRGAPPANGNGNGKRAAPRRRQPLARWARNTLRAGLWAAVAAAIVVGPAWLWRAGLVARAAETAWSPIVEASAALGLVVREVVAEGRRETKRAELLAALGIKGGEPILAFDPDDARKRIEALPWVRSAAVERRLPDTIRIRILERRAMAWWQKDGKLVLIDRFGDPIPVAASGRFDNLIVLVGDDAPAHAAELIRMLGREPDLAGRVHAAVRVGARRWNLRMDAGIDVRLPEDGSEAAWAKLAELERKHGILSRDIEAVDLRLPDRLIVQTKAGRIPASLTGGRDT